MGCQANLQGIFLTQESNLCLLHCRRILYCWTTGEARVLLLASSTNRSEILLNIHQFIGHLPQQIIHFQLSTFLLLRIRVVWVHLYLSEYYRDQVRASLVAQTEKSLPSMLENWVRFLGLEDPLEKEMATHSGTLAWKIPWMEEPDGLQSMGSQRVGHDWVPNKLSLEGKGNSVKEKSSSSGNVTETQEVLNLSDGSGVIQLGYITLALTWGCLIQILNLPLIYLLMR